MILKTPVLTLDDDGLWYERQGDEENSWVCAEYLAALFVCLPPKIILHGSTRSGPKAVKVHLTGPGYLYNVDAAEEGAHEGQLCQSLFLLKKRFLGEGHATIYVSMYECE